MPKREGKIYVANQTGSATIDDQNYQFFAGVTRVREGHPLQKQCPDFFQEVEDVVQYEWETASQAPGEKRGDQKGTSSGSSSRS